MNVPCKEKFESPQSGKQLYNLTAEINGRVLKLATILIFEDSEPLIEPTFLFSLGIIEAAKHGGILHAQKIWSNKAGKNLQGSQLQKGLFL